MWLNVAGGKNESKHSTLFCGLIRTSQLPTVKMLHPLVRDVGGGVSDQRRPDLPKYSADAVEAAEFIKTPFSSALLKLLSSASAASSTKTSSISSSLDSSMLQYCMYRRLQNPSLTSS